MNKILINDAELLLRDVAVERALEIERRLKEVEESRRIESNDRDDFNLWQKFMQWSETFHGKDIRVSETNPPSPIISISYR